MNESATLKMISCFDSPDMATSCRHALDILRSKAAALGRSAVEAASLGYYLNSAGNRVDWSALVRHACSAKLCIAPDAQIPVSERAPQSETRVQVSNETTLQASRRRFQGIHRPLALNFANGVHAGGGFLNGARAQEEALYRSSALYSTLVDDPCTSTTGGVRGPILAIG